MTGTNQAQLAKMQKHIHFSPFSAVSHRQRSLTNLDHHFTHHYLLILDHNHDLCLQDESTRWIEITPPLKVHTITKPPILAIKKQPQHVNHYSS